MYAYADDLAQAQDLVQEAFYRAYDRWAKVSTYDDPVAWVRRVAWNLATSRWRRLRTANRHVRGYREEHVPGPGPDRIALSEALRNLPANPKLADLAVSAEPLVFGPAANGVRSGHLAVTVRNTGPSPMPFTVEIQLPYYATVSPPAGCRSAPTSTSVNVTCDIDGLAVGTSRVLTIALTAPADADRTELVFTPLVRATVRDGYEDPGRDNNQQDISLSFR